MQPVFLSQEQAIDYATCRACFRSGEIPVLGSTGNVERTVAFSEGEERWRKISFDTRLRSDIVRMRQVR